MKIDRRRFAALKLAGVKRTSSVTYFGSCRLEGSNMADKQVVRRLVDSGRPGPIQFDGAVSPK